MNFLNAILRDMDDEDDDRDCVRLLRHEYNRSDHFNYYSDSEFKLRFRIDKENVVEMLRIFQPDLEFQTERNNPISPMTRLLVTLRYYATGAFQLVIADAFGISKSSAHRIVHQVTQIIQKHRHNFIKLPETPEERREVQLKNFQVANFPSVLGFIDGTHIKLFCPGRQDGEQYRNRKGVFSINVQCVANADLKIMDVTARWGGSAHDSTMFNASVVKGRLESGEFGDMVLLGDSAYGLCPYMMTPLTNPTTRAEIIYNKAHICTRNCIERAFGIWKRRFPIIGLITQVKVDNVRNIIVATIVLHNILRDLNDDEPPEDPDIVVDWDESDSDSDDDTARPATAAALRRQALNRQRFFINHFSQY